MRNKTVVLSLLFLMLILCAPVYSTQPLPEAGESITTTRKEYFDRIDKDTTVHRVTAFRNEFEKEYMSDEDFRYEEHIKGKNFLSRLIDSIASFLKNIFPFFIENTNGENTLLTVRIISGLIILAVIYFVVRFVINHQGKWFFQKKNQTIPFDINNTEQLIEHADFEKLISETERTGDTRQSIRLYYLWLLKELKEKNLINWLPEKTNTDYLYELKDDTLRKQFEHLSYLYSYIWYGEFSISDKEYHVAKEAFLSYLRKERQNG